MVGALVKMIILFLIVFFVMRVFFRLMYPRPPADFHERLKNRVYDDYIDTKTIDADAKAIDAKAVDTKTINTKADTKIDIKTNTQQTQASNSAHTQSLGTQENHIRIIDKAESKPESSNQDELMVCDFCGKAVPAHEAIQKGNHAFCSVAHLLAYYDEAG